MIKYSYTIGNQTVETLNLSEVPNGVSYETITFEQIEESETPIITPINDIIIDLLTKQVEALTDEQKNVLLQNLLTN
jgi:hypothetical protein